MTVSTTTASASFLGNGVSTTFPCDFKVFDEAHLEVYVDGALQTLNTHYTVSGIGNDITDVVFVTPPTGSAKVSVFRKIALTQEVDYLENDEFPAETHERALDLLTMFAQQLETATMRALRAPAADPASISLTLPAVADRAGKVLSFDSAGEPTTTTTLPEEATVSAFGETLIDDASATEALQTLAPSGVVVLHHPDANANNEPLTHIRFRGLDSVGNETDFVRIKTEIAVATNGAESGRFFVMMPVTDSAGVEWPLFKLGPDTDLRLESQKNGVSSSPSVILIKNSPVPVNNDQGPQYISRGKNSAGEEIDYALWKSKFDNVADGSETGRIQVLLAVAGALDTNVLEIQNRGLLLTQSGCQVLGGAGSPEGVITAGVGSIWLRNNGGANTSLYVKESGAGNTGWRAVTTAAP